MESNGVIYNPYKWPKIYKWVTGVISNPLLEWSHFTLLVAGFWAHFVKHGLGGSFSSKKNVKLFLPVWTKNGH